VSSPFTYDPRTPLPWALSGCSFPTTAATQITAKKQHSNRICHNSSFHTVNVALIYWLLHGRVDRWHSHLSCSHAAIDTTKLVTIERFFSSGFSRDFRTEISCFVPILHKIPVEWTKKITKKATKNRHHEQSPPTRISLPVANFHINPQSSWVQMALLPMETEYRGSC
jgi:hypothetical protein